MSKRTFAGTPVISASGRVEGKLDDDMEVTMLGAGQEVSEQDSRMQGTWLAYISVIALRSEDHVV